VTSTFPQLIEAAERIVRGETGPDLNTLARQADSLDLRAAAGPDEHAYLAVLLDWLGLRGQSARVLRWGNAEDAGLLNLQGMLAARHGHDDQAISLLRRALAVAGGGTLIRTRILANLAAAGVRAGLLREAAGWHADASRARADAGDPAVDVLLASVQAAIARADGDKARILAAATALGEASRARIAQLDSDHPRALAVVANLAAAEFELARTVGTPRRRSRAIDVLDVTARRLAADLGADHPQALAVTGNLCLAELATACSGAGRRAAADALATVSRRTEAALGRDHPQAREIAAATAAARRELAEAGRRRPRRVLTMVVGAAAAIALAAGISIAAISRSGSRPTEFAAALTGTTLAPDASGEVTLTKTTGGWRITLTASGLPRLDNGRYYQAWLKNSAGILVPVGTFNQPLGITLWAGVPPTSFPVFTVTRQRADGGPASSGQRVLVGTAHSVSG